MPLKVNFDYRTVARGISIADLVISLILAVTLGGLSILISPLWEWKFVDSTCPSPAINGNYSTTSETPPPVPSSSLFGDVKSEKDLMILWLFYMTVMMISFIRIIAACALFKATGQNKPPHKAMRYSLYWITVNVLCMVVGGYIVYQMYGGTFSKVNFLSSFEYWIYWISLSYQITAVICVLLFIFRG